MEYRVYTDSEKSYEITHPENEDSYLFSEFSFMRDKKIKLIVIADGMGGLSDGAKASKNAVNGFTAKFYREVLRKYTGADMEQYSLRYAVNDIKKILIRAVAAANKEVCRNTDPYTNTGSTITAVCIIDDCAVIANVGDSPVYFYKKKERRLRLVSELHTKAERDVKAGCYARYSEEYFQNDHILYNSLGQYATLDTQDVSVTAIGNLEEGDAILAGTDGSFGCLQEHMIQELIHHCGREEEEFFLQHLFSLTRLDKDDDQTAVYYVVA